MLQEAFYWIFNMSISAAITGSIVLCLGRIRKIPKRISVFLWIIPFFRMAFPIGLSSPYSIMSLLSKLSTRTVTVYKPANDLIFSMMNFSCAADTYFPITYKVDVLAQVFRVGAWIWLIGCVALLLIIATVYISTLWVLRSAEKIRENIYVCPGISTPMVVGVIRPKIFLPDREVDTELVLLHEKTHIRRGDNLWRLLALFLVSVHWFNPFCWLFLRRLLGDMEQACDECVLLKAGPMRAKEYAQMLLDSAEQRTVLTSGFGGSKLRSRIQNILSFQKLTWFSMGVFTALIAVIAYLLLTNAG